MSVDQRGVVDFIGTSKTDGHVILTIADHLPFDGGTARLVVLQEKLNDYLAFIESGEIYETYPAARGQELEISIRFKFAPDERALDFIHAAREAIRDAGIRLSHEAFSG